LLAHCFARFISAQFMRDGDHVTVVHSYSRAEAGAAFDAQLQTMKDTVAGLLKENKV
jgi:hypothetical protein